MSIRFALLVSAIFVSSSMEDEQPSGGLQKKGLGTSIHKLFLLPGTKWCGPGHIAKSYNDLGRHRKVDMCCREHDRHCSIGRIKGLKKKYGLRNWSWKTASHCDCEIKFKKCLQKLKSESSKDLFDIYFYTLNPRCILFKTVREKVCVKRKWFRCKKYKTVTKRKAYFVNLHKAVGLA